MSIEISKVDFAKADGLVTIDEVAAFSRVFRSAPGDEAAMRRVFDIARQTVHGYESYAKRIARRSSRDWISPEGRSVWR